MQRQMCIFPESWKRQPKNTNFAHNVTIKIIGGVFLQASRIKLDLHSDEKYSALFFKYSEPSKLFA